MRKYSIITRFIFFAALLISILFLTGANALSQFPVTFNYITNPLFYSGYGYFNTIDGYLLGYLPFTPFLGPAAAAAYNLAGIPTYPYVTSPYQTAFTYATLPGTVIPYARFDYPAYVYGSPDYYLSWVLLQ